MFDASWSELLCIAVLALVLLGPKELPLVLKSIGKWAGKAQRLVNDFRRQIDQYTSVDALEAEPLKSEEVVAETKLESKDHG